MFSPGVRDETGPALWASTWSGERYPRVPGDHVVVDGEDGLSVHPDPGHLIQDCSQYLIVGKDKFCYNWI